MKANELIIGDWIYLIKDYFKIKKELLKIDALDLYRISDGMLEVEPIPLTAEILEKNGFKYDQYYHSWVCDVFTINYGHLLDEEGDYLFIWVADISMKLTYVHELQHALRLCGMNDLLDNFSV